MLSLGCTRERIHKKRPVFSANGTMKTRESRGEAHRETGEIGGKRKRLRKLLHLAGKVCWKEQAPRVDSRSREVIATASIRGAVATYRSVKPNKKKLLPEGDTKLTPASPPYKITSSAVLSDKFKSKQNT